MKFQSVNPYNGAFLDEFEAHDSNQTLRILEASEKAFQDWRNSSFSSRSELMTRLGDALLSQADFYARTISLEMGKPITEAVAEVKKCAWVCDFYAANAEELLADALIKTDADESFISYDPLGCILGIMPWNYPFWQVLRYAVPTIMAGNTTVLKHAPNVFGSAKLIQDLFEDVGFPTGVFQNLFIDHTLTERIIEHNLIKGVTLTGSERAGSAVASLAGRNIKKTVMELGGSNAFVVLGDADIDKAIELGVLARMQNTGQSCIAAKRFFVADNLYDKFLEGFLEGVKCLKVGDPIEQDTKLGVLARKDLAEQLNFQVKKSVEKGAKLVYGGSQKEAFHEATVLVNVKPGMSVFDEETFGPVAPIMKFKTEEEAFQLAAQTKYGLGISVFTQDTERMLDRISSIPDGAVFVNDMVKSDPRLPFGGTGASGYGRELSAEGIMEFVNAKTVYIKG